MLVALHCQDKAGALQTRLDNRAAHLDHIKSSGIVRQAGPLLDGDGQMCGSLIVLEVEEIAEAEDWAARDPYALAGLFENVSLQHWNRVVDQ